MAPRQQEFLEAVSTGVYRSAFWHIFIGIDHGLMRAGSDSRRHRHGVGLLFIIFRIIPSGSIFLSERWGLEFQHYESSLSVDFKSSVRVSFGVLFSFDF